MDNPGSLTTEPPPGKRALVHLRPKQSAPTEPSYIEANPGGLNIPVQVVARQLEHAAQHSNEEWDAIKPVIQKLYLEEDRPLKLVMRMLAEDYNFRATIRMYKTRFRRWGWRKHQSQDQRQDPRQDQRRAAVLSNQRIVKRTAPLQLRIQHVMAPDLLSDQEVPISISRNYTIDESGSQRWNCIVLNMSDPKSAGHQQSIVRFCDAETAYVNTIHQLKSGRIQDAFQSLNKLFDSMTGSALYLHPKYLTGFWLLCHGIFNACSWNNDDDFHLLQELLCFHGRNAAVCFQKSSSSSSSSSSHPIVSLMRSVARMSRSNPRAMKDTFRTAYRAAAISLEEKLGENHPVVLVTWTDYFWYFNFPVDHSKNLVARQEIALVEAEAASGRDADVTICLLNNLTFFLFYCLSDDERARKALADLLDRTSGRIAAQASPTESSFHLQRAHAFASLLQGLFMLQDNNELTRCQEVIWAAIEWLRLCGGSDAYMHARMLEVDFFLLTKGWKEGQPLRELTLTFAKPRSAGHDEKKS